MYPDSDSSKDHRASFIDVLLWVFGIALLIGLVRLAFTRTGLIVIGGIGLLSLLIIGLSGNSPSHSSAEPVTVQDVYSPKSKRATARDNIDNTVIATPDTINLGQPICQEILIDSTQTNCVDSATMVVDSISIESGERSIDTLHRATKKKSFFKRLFGKKKQVANN